MKYLLFIFLAFVVACQQEKEHPKITLPTNKDIEDVIETVIEQDSLPLFRRDEKEFTYKPKKNEVIINVRSDLNIYLRKNYFYVRDLEYRKDDVPPPPTDNQGVIEYYNLLKKSEGLFSKQDSLYLYYQCENQRIFILPSSFKYKYSIIEKTPLKWKDTINTTFIDFSVPIFTSDRRSAYVTITTHYGIGNFLAEYFYLNNNKNWIIVSKGELFRGCM